MARALSKSVEDYLKAIYVLQERYQRASTQLISQELSVSKASVTGMLKSLAEQKYIRYEPYKGSQLTAKGRSVATNLLRRHRLIELFLAETLGLSWDELHEDAEVLEHAVSDKLIERIAEHLGHPEFDPHGQPIPQPDGVIPDHCGVSLDTLEAGQKGNVVEVTDGDPEFLRYLTSLNIKMGSRIKIENKAPYEGPIEIRIGRTTTSLGVAAARRIWVTETD